MFWIRR